MQRDKVCDMFTNYSRERVLKALERIARPARDHELLAVWLEISDTEKIKEVECIKPNGGDEYEYLRIAFFAAVVDMIEQKTLCHDKDGFICLTEWMPDPKRMRSVDDEWTS